MTITDPAAVAADLERSISGLIVSRKFEQASQLLDEYRQINPASVWILNFEVWLLVAQERAFEALQHLSALEGDRSDALRAFCLKVLDDPLWEGIATRLLDSPYNGVRAGMRRLLRYVGPEAVLSNPVDSGAR